MNHAFNAEVARQYGLKEAVLISNFQFWIKKNAKNNCNQHDGRFWSFNTIEAIAQSFPYLTVNEVRRGIDNLVKSGVLLKAKYNRAAYDQTRWYAFADEKRWLFSDEKPAQAAENIILQNCQMDSAESSNPFGETARPIPDTNPNTKPDTNLKDIIFSSLPQAQKIEILPEQQPTPQPEIVIEQKVEIQQPAPAADEITLELTPEQQECFDWAERHDFWYTAAITITAFLKVYNHEKQTLKKQFDGYKKARSKTWKVNGLNSQLPNEKTNNRGANYETHKQFNQRKSSLYDENGRRLCAEEQVIRATGNHNNDIRIFDQSGRAVSESEYFGF